MPQPLFSKSKRRRSPGGKLAPRPQGQPPAREGKPHRHGQKQGDPFLLYGLHAVAAAWTNPERLCRRLLATEGALAALAPALDEARRLGLKRPGPEIAGREAIDRLLPGAVHQGVALDAQPLEAPSLDEILAATEGKPAYVIALDQVTDPHNVGAILRSASAFGAAAVIVTRHNAPAITGALAKAASGAVEHMPYVPVPNLARALDALGEAGFATIALDERAEKTLAELGQSLGGFDRAALVMGAEGEGLRRLTRETCRHMAKLPTGGPVGSLNVSNAAAVALYELARGEVKLKA